MLKIRSYFSNHPIWFKLAGIIITSITGAVLFVYFFGASSFNVRGALIEISAVPSFNGRTIIDISPFGSISANTHKAPFIINLSLEHISIDLIQESIEREDTPEKLLNDLDKNKQDIVGPFVMRQIILGFSGGFFLLCFLWRPKLKIAILGSIIGGVFVSLLILWGAATYEPEAFQEPEYTGIIALAPDMIRVGEKILDKFEDFQNKTALLIVNIRSLFTRLDYIPFMGNPLIEEGTRSILLISDIHSNPVGIEIANAIVKNFAVDFVIDAGDLTDFGSPLETKMTEDLRNMGVPYLFAPGNHDTLEISAFVDELENALVLRNSIVNIAGIKVLGSPDPLSDSYEVAFKDRKTSVSELQAQVRSFYETVEKEGRADIIVMHNPDYANELSPLASVVVNGHIHKAVVRRADNGSIILNAGTTGAAGIRGIYNESNVPYSAMILYMKPEQAPVAVDLIFYYPLSSRFSIERYLLKGKEIFEGDQ